MYRSFKFRPKLFDCLSGYNLKAFGSDVSAGVTVGVIALPMAMAFAIGSGLKPEAGIITAVIAGLLTSLLGGSRVAIGGPTGAFVGIVAGIVASHGVSGLLICTMMAGAILFLMGLVRLGGLIRFIPSPLIKGFTTGIAVIILGGQLRDFFGISTAVDNSNLLTVFMGIIPELGNIHIATLLIGVASLALIMLWPARFNRYVPGSIAAMLLITGVFLLVNKTTGISVETIASRYGGIPRTLPFPSLPDFDLATFQKLFSPALTIALLGAIESLLCATAADSMIDDEHKPDQELMAQGIANFVSPFFGGLPATGAMARTAANIRNGGRTPVAGIVHAITLLLIMLVAAPLARFIPLAVLSAVLIVVAINMGDWREFKYLRRYPRSDAMVFLTTFILTIIFGLTQAVFAGMFLACVLFIRGISVISQVGTCTLHHHDPEAKKLADQQNELESHYIAEGHAHDDILMVQASGAMFFGAAKKLKGILQYQRDTHKVMILRMGRVITLDATALFTLEEIFLKFRAKNIEIILVHVRAEPMRYMRRAGLLSDIDPRNIVENVESAINRATEIIDAQREEEESRNAEEQRAAQAAGEDSQPDDDSRQDGKRE